MALPKMNTARYDAYVPSLGKTVKFRPYLVKEEKILMIALESTDQQQVLGAVKDVIRSCVLDNIDVDKLAIFDIESLFLKLRSKSVGEGIDLNIKCKECDVENPVFINVEDIEDPELNDDDKLVKLTDTVGVTMRYPSFADIEKFKEEELETVSGVMSLLTDCIETIYDEENVHEASKQSKKELTEFVESLSSEQFQGMSSFFENMPSISHDLKFDCASCKEHNTIELRGLQSFFT